MSQVYKVNSLFVNNLDPIKRYQVNQYRYAYMYDTKNELYKQFQRKLYKLGYEVDINGNFARTNMYFAMCEYSSDNYKMNHDVNGICYYSLYDIMFSVKDKIVAETDLYNNETPGNDYSFLNLKSDFFPDVDKRFLVILNPLDEYGEKIIKSLMNVLNFYKTNYLDVKQYHLKESLKDRIQRIKDLCSRRKTNPIVLNIGNAYDYSVDPGVPTLLRGINIYYNRGMVLGDSRKTEIYVQYLAKKLNKYLASEFEYIRTEGNYHLPILKDLGDIASFQIEIGYTNNPIDRIILQNPTLNAKIANSLSHSIQRITSFKDTKRYTWVDV